MRPSVVNMRFEQELRVKEGPEARELLRFFEKPFADQLKLSEGNRIGLE
jgi:hypothetical protein